MRAFFGVQIKEECRGNLATVVNRQELTNPVGTWSVYRVFIQPTDSEDFIHLTGVRDPTNPLERVYVGVSFEIGNRIANLLSDKLDVHGAYLRRVDESVVIPHFLDKYPEAPKEIILRPTSTGYKVVETD